MGDYSTNLKGAVDPFRPSAIFGQPQYFNPDAPVVLTSATSPPFEKTASAYDVPNTTFSSTSRNPHRKLNNELDSIVKRFMLNEYKSKNIHFVT